MVLETMVFVLGMVAASLFGMLVVPMVVRRAVRRTRSTMIAALPQSQAEIDAARDHLRARHAQTQRRLEHAIARLNENLARRMVETNRQHEEAAALTARQVELSATVAGLERRTAELTTTLERTDHRLSAASAELILREERLKERAAEIQHLKSNVAIRDLLTEEQRLELVARETTIGNLNDALLVSNAATAATAAARDELATELATEQLRVAEREERIRAIQAARDALLGERDEQIRGLEAARDVLGAERNEHLAELERRAAAITTLEAALAEADVLRHQSAALEDALAALRAENLMLRGAAGAASEAERQQNTELRERLDEIAALVVRMVEPRAVRALASSTANGHSEATPRERAAEPAAAVDKAAVRTNRRALAARLKAQQRAGASH